MPPAHGFVHWTTSLRCWGSSGGRHKHASRLRCGSEEQGGSRNQTSTVDASHFKHSFGTFRHRWLPLATKPHQHREAQVPPQTASGPVYVFLALMTVPCNRPRAIPWDSWPSRSLVHTILGPGGLQGEGLPAPAGAMTLYCPGREGLGHCTAHPPNSDGGCLRLVARGGVFRPWSDAVCRIIPHQFRISVGSIWLHNPCHLGVPKKIKVAT